METIPGLMGGALVELMCESLMAMMALTPAAALAQAVQAVQNGPLAMVSRPAQRKASAILPGQVLREIDDPHNGGRWLLLRDESHPGGPGLLTLVVAARCVSGQHHGADPEAKKALPAIRSGDRVIVEESTPVAEARLEAVAMGQAIEGSVFQARLMIGGRVVRAVAIGPDRAVFEGARSR